ncbi:type II secretion system F family protein [Labrys sp. 22185]|uniref:type II secretion system F family protein n=1 Tax=Labrys sp. 22185 TaxID=3453888 RepID=UPI003F826C0B
MPSFRYRAVTKLGKTEGGSIVAPDQSQALQNLVAKGLTVTSLQAAKDRREGKKKTSFSLRPDDVVMLLREWATLLSAGLTIDETLAICGAGGKSPKVVAAVAALRRLVRDGQRLHAALRELAFLPREAIVLIEAGETAGALPRVLDRLATDFSQRRSAQEGIVTALLYPAVLLVTAMVAVVMIVVVVAPNLAELFENSSGHPPARVAALLSFCAFVRQAFPWFGVAAVIMALSFVVLSRFEAWRMRFDAFILRLPFWGAILRSRDSARFAAAGALMIECGVVPTRALPLAASAMNNRWMRTTLTTALGQASQGAPLREALAGARALPADVLALIDAGVQTGRLAEVLHHGATLHAARATARIQRFSALLTPAITVFAGLVVGALAYLVLSAVVSLNEVAFQ